MSDFSEEMQESDTEGNNEKVTEKMSNFSEIQKSDTEGGNNETVPQGKEQDPLLKEIESEISRAVDFSHVSSQVCSWYYVLWSIYGSIIIVFIIFVVRHIYTLH